MHLAVVRSCCMLQSKSLLFSVSSQTKEVELQCRVEDLEKQTYRDNQIQARMEEVEAKLEALTLEKRRLESENCVLKTQVEYQQRVRAAQLN